MGILRRFLQSRFGVVIALALFGIIAIGFALSSVTGSGGLGGFTTADNAATVGRDKVSTADLSRGVDRLFNNAHDQDPKLTMQSFVATGGFEQAVIQILDRAAITTFGGQNGIVAGKRLVDSELAKIPSLQGPDGHFSDKNYQQLLAQRQLTDADVRGEIGAAMVAKQALFPAEFGAGVPAGTVRAYAALLKEKRIGALGAIPAAAFAPKAPPSDAVLAAYYASHRAAFMLPERRIIRYALFDAGTVKNLPPPSDAEIAAFYQANAAQYAASESRKVTLLIMPDEAGAKAAAASGSLDAAARAKGLATSVLGPLTRDALAQQSTPEVAAAAFAAHAGAITGPVRTALGWYVLRVDAVSGKPAKSLAQAHDDIAAALIAQKRQSALSDLTQKIDDQFERGGALTDAAKAVGTTISTAGPLTANGQMFGRPGQTAPKELARILPTAFAMEREHAPQLADMGDAKHFILFDVDQITRAAPAPLAEIKGAVATTWALEQGNAGAKMAAMKVLGEVKKGKDLGKALAELGLPLPPVQQVSMGREDLARFKGQVPPAISLFFGMAAGTTKLLPADGNRGWAVLQLRQVIPGTVAPNDPMLADAGKELSGLVGNEYADELRTAIRNQVGVTRNEAAIAALKKQLNGGS